MDVLEEGAWLRGNRKELKAGKVVEGGREGGVCMEVMEDRKDVEIMEDRKDVERSREATQGLESCVDDLSEPFPCVICLELVHKPVVNACGHMFCFWCVHKAMSTGTESYCPLCRKAYIHFPRICEQLHFLLLKAVPEVYRRRIKEVHEEEVSWGFFSPQFNDGLNLDVSGGEYCIDVSPASILDGVPLAPNEVGNVRSLDAQDDHILKGKLLDTSSSSSTLTTGLKASEAVRESVDASEGGTPSSPSYVTVSDLLCGACKKLLYRPVVVNCGHVFCEECARNVEDTGDATLKCFTCGSMHPGSFPNVCLELHQYLEQYFNVEYERRRCELETELAQLPEQKGRNNLSKDLQPADMSKKMRTSPQPHPMLHSRIGCDGCGMFPMVGRRFNCIDCPKPGYDLCFPCYKNGKNLTGRFNQQHNRKHRVQEVIGSSSPFNDDLGEGSEGMETYFGIVGYFA